MLGSEAWGAVLRFPLGANRLPVRHETTCAGLRVFVDESGGDSGA